MPVPFLNAQNIHAATEGVFPFHPGPGWYGREVEKWMRDKECQNTLCGLFTSSGQGYGHSGGSCTRCDAIARQILAADIERYGEPL